MEKYRLKQWYPNLHLAWSTTDNYEYDREDNRMYNRTRWGTISITAPYLHPDFWELIEEKEPLFITEDGAEIFHSMVPLWEVLSDFEKVVTTVELVKVDCKYFFLEANADEYIWRNKRVFSYEDMMKAKRSIILKSEDIEKAAKERSKE